MIGGPFWTGPVLYSIASCCIVVGWVVRRSRGRERERKEGIGIFTGGEGPRGVSSSLSYPLSILEKAIDICEVLCMEMTSGRAEGRMQEIRLH